MKVGINLLFLKPGLAGGTETYSISLLKAMSHLTKNNIEYHIFCSSEMNLQFLSGFSQFNIVRFNRVSRSLAYRFFFEQVIFPFKLRKYNLNILHSYGYIGPLFTKNHIVTIHDTNAFAHKKAMPVAKKILLRFFLLATAKRCSHIITVSHFSKQEIVKYLKVSANKISVIYEAGKYDVQTNENYTLPAQYAHLWQNPYFIGLSSVSPHKNITTLILAFKQLVTKFPNLKLVLAGHLPAGNTNIGITDDVINGKIIFTGFVDDIVLMSLLKNACCFVFPSLYEGFGLPLLEAQALEVPVIASNMGSLPEIGADSALYFQATNANELAKVMSEFLTDTEKKALYIKKGLENIKRFSWDKAAVETLQLYLQRAGGI